MNQIRALAERTVAQIWPEPSQIVEPEPPRHRVPIDALGPQAQCARDIQVATKCPLALAVASVLGTMSLAAQGICDVQFRNNTACPTSLFLVTLGASGERKSSADSLSQIGVKRHIKNLRAQARSTASQMEAGLHDGPPDPDPNIITGSGSSEGIVKALCEGHPSQGLFSDEGGAFFGGTAFRRENHLTGLTSLAKLWDGNAPGHRLRGIGAKTEYVGADGLRFTVSIMGQRAALFGFLADKTARGQGTLARICVHEPQSTIGTRQTTFEEWQCPAVTGAVMGFADRVEELLRQSIPKDADGNVTRPVIELAEDASRMLHAFANEVESSLAPGGAFEGFADIINKTHEIAARMAGIFAVFRGCDTVTAEVMADAIQMATYFMTESVRIAKIAPRKGAENDALRIAAYVQKQDGRVAVRYFSRQGPKGLRTELERKAAIELLTSANWLRIEGKDFVLSPLLAASGLLGGADA